MASLPIPSAPTRAAAAPNLRDIADAVQDVIEWLTASHGGKSGVALDPWPPAPPLRNALAALDRTVQASIDQSISVPAARGAFILAASMARYLDHHTEIAPRIPRPLQSSAPPPTFESLVNAARGDGPAFTGGTSGDRSILASCGPPPAARDVLCAAYAASDIATHTVETTDALLRLCNVVRDILAPSLAGAGVAIFTVPERVTAIQWFGSGHAVFAAANGMCGQRLYELMIVGGAAMAHTRAGSDGHARGGFRSVADARAAETGAPFALPH
jgi:hypothetical protein